MRGRKHTVVTAETIKVEHLSASKYLCANMLKSNLPLIASYQLEEQIARFVVMEKEKREIRNDVGENH